MYLLNINKMPACNQGEIILENAQQTMMSDVYEIGGLEWQTLPPEAENPDYLIIICNQQCKKLWYCEAAIYLTSSEEENSSGKIEWEYRHSQIKHCFNTFNKFGILFKNGKSIPYRRIRIAIKVAWSIVDFPVLDADLKVEYNGMPELVPINQHSLASYTSYFDNLIFGDWKEKNKLLANPDEMPEHEIQEDANFDLTAFTFMIYGMHVLGPLLPNKLPFPDWANEDMQTKVALLKLAIKYQFPVCAKFAEQALIARRSNCTELLEVLDVADVFGLESLKQHCLQSITASEYCMEYGKNIQIYNRMRKEMRQQLDARLEQSAEQARLEQSAEQARLKESEERARLEEWARRDENAKWARLEACTTRPARLGEQAMPGATRRILLKPRRKVTPRNNAASGVAVVVDLKTGTH